MPFRVKIISPLKATETDLARRQKRYNQVARADTAVSVENLEGGPSALNSSGDVLASAAAIYQQGKSTQKVDFEAILIDCVFDPAVEELKEATGLPIFGPTQVTLPLISQVSSNFSIVARTSRQCELLSELVDRYGFGLNLCSWRALDISYEEAKQEAIFNKVMLDRLQKAVLEDKAKAILFGSTTMALTNEMKLITRGAPMFMPGMVALKVMEQLWYDQLWPGENIS